MVIAEVSPGLLPLLAAVPAAGGQKGACVGDEMTWKVHKARVHDDIGTRDLPHLDFTGPGPAPRLWQGLSKLLGCLASAPDDMLQFSQSCAGYPAAGVQFLNIPNETLLASRFAGHLMLQMLILT